MHNLIKRMADAFAGLIVGLALAAIIMGPAAMALVFPGQYAPRLFPTQQTHYERHLLQINASGTAFTGDSAQNSCIFATTGTLQCSLRIGALPYNAFVVRGYVQPAVVCNAATTCTLSIGTASLGTQIINAQDIKGAGTAGIAATIVAANLGVAATGNNVASTGADGGFDLYATITFTGAVPTTGTIVVVIEYFGPNDGGCPTNVAFPTLANTVGPC